MSLQDDSATGSSAQFAQLLAAINKVEANVDAKLSQMKRELMEERESADDRLVHGENATREKTGVRRED